MTKKDFKLIASVILQERDHPANGSERIRAIEHLAFALALKLATTNPRFDSSRFLAACGVQE